MSSPRRYASERRNLSARQTRQRILEAAGRELSRGYHAMTISGLARAADVSPQTIYNSIGGKAAVVKALYDVRLVGDDTPVPMSERPEFRRLRDQPSVAATLRVYAHVSRLIFGRVGPLLGLLLAEGAGGDADLTSFVATIEAERRTGNGQVVAHLRDRFGLPPTRTETEIRDAIWTVTSWEVADRLTRRCGWSLDAYERWLGDVLVAGVCGVSDEGCAEQLVE